MEEGGRGLTRIPAQGEGEQSPEGAQAGRSRTSGWGRGVRTTHPAPYIGDDLLPNTIMRRADYDLGENHDPGWTKHSPT
jgi:hypothetical protein